MAQTIEQQLQRLADLEEIRQLKARYCILSDRGFETARDDPAAVAALFTADGAWGEASGTDAIRALFEGFQEQLPFAHHMAINPSIEIDGDRASATWYGLIAARTAAGDELWIGGTYSDEFVRTPAGWRFASLRFVQAFNSPR